MKASVLCKICQSFKKLKVLNLSFYDFYSITNQKLNKIIAAIGHNLINLEDLTLDFQSCYNINDETLQVIDLLLKPNLHRLSLSFKDCEGIKVKEIIFLGQAIY